MKTDSINRPNYINGAFSRYSHAAMRLLFAAWTSATIIGGLFGCNSVNETPTIAPTAAPTTAQPEQTPVPTPTRPVAVKSPVGLLPRVEAELKKAVAARLNSWKASIEARDLEKHLQHYADQIDTYYLSSNVNRDFIRDDRRRAFEQFDTLKLQFINVDINLPANDAAIVTFDKSWDFRRAENFSNGLVQHEIQMRKIEKKWFIVSEKDLQIYRYRNN